MDENSHSEEELKKEIAYYKKQLDQLSGQSVRHDFAQTTLRHSLRQKNDAFAAINILQKKYVVGTPLHNMFEETAKALTTSLNMNRTVVLVPASSQNSFKPGHWYGYPAGQFNIADPKEIELPPALLRNGQFLLINKKAEIDEIARQIQDVLAISFFIGVPVIHDDAAVGFIITGRLVERPPFSPVLDKGDIDSLTTITSLISTVLQNTSSVELQLAKKEIEKENIIITEQRDQLEKTLKDLKAAQAQLIQSEKMASLGELTAGIAHEIQNPLNFVNNFSDVNAELIDEAKLEMEKGNIVELKAILNDIKDNEQKINHHGKRADAIVKNMLQHSRTSSGQKEPTDINALADEYLRLAYHGLRAKDKSFNATTKTDFGENIGTVNLIPQDIGRVILNLINNAFYAVDEKKKHTSTGSVQNARPDDLVGRGYEPIVSLCTKKNNGKVEISVKDNGNGIPQKIVDKIFQPFFTTKPTGQGTGLGLSLSYDIVKAHGGELKVETKEGEGTEFIIKLSV